VIDKTPVPAAAAVEACLTPRRDGRGSLLPRAFAFPASTTLQAASTLATSSSLALLRQLEWRVRHAVENVLSGEYRSAFRGRGMEFDQVVKYEFGDDVRDIDWNVTARLGEPYRKKFVEEREVTLLVVFEDSPPAVRFRRPVQTRSPAGTRRPRDAARRGQPRPRRLRPRASGRHTFREPVRGRGQILHAAARCSAARPRRVLARATGPLDSVETARKAPPRHSILIWLGDFPPRPAPEGWAVMTRRYQTMGFRVDDPWERDPSRPGPIRRLRSQRATRDAGGIGRRTRRARRLAAGAGRGMAVALPRSAQPPRRGTEEDRLDALVRFFHARQRAVG
jgi:hypothetical protein